MKPKTWAERLVKAYLKLGKPTTLREAQAELGRAQRAGLSAGYVVTSLEKARFK